MPPKHLKKPALKKKQNGKKTAKGQKQKYETESSPKEQITELDKEILSIKINEFEGKLSRKKHLCSYMEEEISIYKTLYEEKQLLKSESMKVLNKAFEDFSTEIFLLDQELNAMQHVYNEILQEKMFCALYKKKVEKLKVIEDKLGEDLSVAEKCVEELPELREKLAKLEENDVKEKEKFICEKQHILSEFETCLLSIQTELNLSINKAIGDKSLKLDLLPAPYKSLFQSGFRSESWLDSSSQFYDSLRLQNEEIRKTYSDLLSALVSGQEKVKMFFSHHDVLILFQLRRGTKGDEDEWEKPDTFEVDRHPDEYNKHLLQLERMSMEQELKVKSMRNEIKNLEWAIKPFEVSGETTFEKSYLIQIICKAGSLLKQEL